MYVTLVPTHEFPVPRSCGLLMKIKEKRLSSWQVTISLMVLCMQVRATQCMVRLGNVSRPVDSTLCVDNGLEAPEILQRCGFVDCPQWFTGPWSQVRHKQPLCLPFIDFTQEHRQKKTENTIPTKLPVWQMLYNEC